MDYDIETLGKALDFVSKGTKAADSAFGLAKRIKEIFHSPKPASEKPELEGLLLELMQEMTDTKLANVDLKEQLITLREHAIEARQREQEFERYELIETPGNAMVFRLKPSLANGEPTHYICPNCKEERVRSILQGPRHYRTCPKCKTGFDIENIEPAQYSSEEKSVWDY